MPQEQRKRLKSLEVCFDEGDIVFAEGDPTRDMYILLEGEVQIQKAGRPIATIRDPDTYLGELSTLLGTPRTATLMATVPCRMIRVPEAKVTDFFAHSPALGIKLARVLANRLQQMNVKYDRLLREAPPETPDARIVMEHLTRDEDHQAMLAAYCQKVGESIDMAALATELGLPEEAIPRLLLTFATHGLIEFSACTLRFVESPDKPLRQSLLTWAVQSPGAEAQ